MDKYFKTTMAVIKSVALLTSILTITLAQNITVHNLDDSVTVLENITVGDAIFTVNATEANSGSITYTMPTTYPSGAPFSVDSASGEVTVESPGLDYESETTYVLTVDATVSSVTESRNLTVDVSDVDEAPVLQNMPAVISIWENVTSAEVVYNITVTDPEGDIVTIFCYVDPDDGSFNGSCEDAFQIVQVADPPFLYNAYTFTVMANDTQGLTSISQMTINVTETTNDSPHLTTLPDTVILMENSTVGTVIYQVLVYDEEDGIITYNITVSPYEETDKFNMTSDGTLVLNGTLDFESHPVYSVTVQACDDQGDCSEAILTVMIGNSNDPPTVSLSHTPVLQENAIVGDGFFLGLNVTDEDGDSFSFFLPSYGHNQHFTIDSVSGNLTLQQTVDCEDYTSFPDGVLNLQIGMQDSSNSVNYFTVDVTIGDVNEFAPVFDEAKYTGAVSEADSAGVSVVTLTVQDDDCTGSPDDLTYTVRSPGGPYFDIVKTGSDTVRLSLGAPIDAENFDVGQKKSEISFQVIADDGSYQDSATVTVSIADVDDNTPTFTQNVYKLYIPSNAEVGYTLGTVEAIDADVGHGVLVYSVVSNSSGVLGVSYLDGTMFVNGPLTEDSYSLTLQTWDLDNPDQIATVEIIVETYDGVDTIVQWEIDNGDEYLDITDVEQLLENIANYPGCDNCVAVADDYYQLDNGTWIVEVTIKTTENNQTVFMSKQEQLDLFTSDGRMTPKDDVVNLSPTGEVISISERFESDDKNWWLDTVEGNVTMAILVLLGLALITTAIVIVADVAYWSKRPGARGYAKHRRTDVRTPRSTRTPSDVEADIPGTPQRTP